MTFVLQLQCFSSLHGRAIVCHTDVEIQFLCFAIIRILFAHISDNDTGMAYLLK